MVFMGNKIKYPVQWHEGMLLRPEHFQQTDRRLDQTLSFHFSCLRPFYWGVHNLKIDLALLAAGRVKIIELTAVMPDGTVAHFSDAEEKFDLSFDLRSLKDSLLVKPHYLYLRLPAYKEDAANSSGDRPRFVSEDSPSVCDENTGEGKINFPCLRPNWSLSVSSENPSDGIALRLAQISLQDNVFILTGYIPPLLKINLNSDLAVLAQEMSQKIRNKIGFLSEQVHSKSLSIVSSEILRILQALTGSLLPFEVLLQSGQSHPFDLYVALSQIASQMTGVLPGQMPLLLNGYNHEDLLTCFSEIVNFLDYMLNHIQEGYSVVAFTLKDRFFNLKLDAEWLKDKIVIGIKAAPQMSSQALVEWINGALIASSSRLESIREKRTLGCQRRIITGETSMQLAPGKDVVLCEVTYDPSFIQADEELFLFNISDTEVQRPLEIVLFLPKNQNNDLFEKSSLKFK